MQTTILTITHDEWFRLSGIVGDAFENLSGRWLDEESSWGKVRIQTSLTALNIEFSAKVMEVGYHQDAYPLLHVDLADSIPKDVIAEGRFLYHGKGERIRAIHVMREYVDCLRESKPYFAYIADCAVAIQLDTMCIAIMRANHASQSLLISRAPTRDLLDLPRPEFEWVSTLIEAYTVRREWIDVTNPPKSPAEEA